MMEDNKNTRVICIASGKGGVGKTTTTAAIAYLFSTIGGKRVLLVDADAQVNLTQIEKTRMDGQHDIQGAIISKTMGANVPMEAFIVPTQYKNIDMIPGNAQIEKDDFLSRIRKAKLDDNMNPWIDMIEAVKSMGKYDIVLMDTHPSSGMATSYPLQACDFVIVPLEPDASSTSGFKSVYQEIVKTRRRVNHNIKLLGYFFNKVKLNTSSAKEYIPSVRDGMPAIIADMNDGVSEGKCFDTVIRDSEDARKSTNFRCAVTEGFSNSNISKDFKSLYYEIVEAMEHGD